MEYRKGAPQDIPINSPQKTDSPSTNDTNPLWVNVFLYPIGLIFISIMWLVNDPSPLAILIRKILNIMRWALIISIVFGLGYFAIYLRVVRYVPPLFHSIKSSPEIYLLILACILAFIAYALPSIVAHMRGHLYFWPIIIINIAFGWTLIGWVGALVWAVWPNGNHPDQQ